MLDAKTRKEMFRRDRFLEGALMTLRKTRGGGRFMLFEKLEKLELELETMESSQGYYSNGMPLLGSRAGASLSKMGRESWSANQRRRLRRRAGWYGTEIRKVYQSSCLLKQTLRIEALVELLQRCAHSLQVICLDVLFARRLTKTARSPIS